MYKLTNNENTIQRLSDGATIPKGHRWYKEYEDWLEEGNTPDPQFTQAELDAQAIHATNVEARKYLADTDWMMQRHYDESLVGTALSIDGPDLVILLALRQDARNAIL